MALSPTLVAKLYKGGDMRPTGEWITCAGVSCSALAAHDVVHEPPDGQRFYVPLCEGCIEAMFERQVEYFMEARGFFGTPDSSSSKADQ